MKYLGAISDSKDLVNKGYVDNAIPTNVSAFTNDAGYITTDTNTTYSLSNALSSHKFTETLTADGSGSGTSTATIELAAGTGISLTDDTSNKKITINCTVTNSDEKVSVAALTSGTAYYPILATGTGTATRQIDSTLGGLKYTSTAGTSTAGTAMLQLGNAIMYGTANNEQGVLRLYSALDGYIDIKVLGLMTPHSGSTVYLPGYASNMYLVGTDTMNAVGNSSVPVYVDINQKIQAVDSIAIGLIDKPFMRVTGSGTNVSLSPGVITQIPLTAIEFQSEYSGISLDTTKHTVLLEPGYYRISGSIYFASGPTYSSSQGIYIRMDSTSIAFANATEVAASYIYGSISINTSTIVKVIDNCYLWLGARSSVAAAIDSDNTATYLTVEKIGSIY